MKKLILLTALWLNITVMQATNYYLSPAGNDANDGLSPRSALATMGAAAAKVKPGDCVLISPGTYHVTEQEISRPIP